MAEAQAMADAQAMTEADALGEIQAETQDLIEEQAKTSEAALSGQSLSAESADADPSWQFVSQAGDSLWAIARSVQRESGGRVVDIVQALHVNNSAAFIENDANKLKIDARLNLSLAQIKAATPVARRAELGRAIKNIAQATNAAPAGASQSSSSATLRSTQSGGVLSLVTNNDKSAAVSPLTQQLSLEVKASSAQVDEELAAGSDKVGLVEERMDNLLNQYEALTEKTSQLKELEETLNRRIADKAQIDIGLDTAAMPVPATPVKNEGLLRNQERNLWWWLQLVLGMAVMVCLVYAIYIALKARHVKNRNAYFQHWDEGVLAPQGHTTDNELAKIVRLKKAASTVARPLDDLSNQQMQVDDSEGIAELQAGLYIAYQRYAEAEELLLQTLEQQPDNRALKNQLLEVYDATNKTVAYDRLLEHLAECDAQAEKQKSHEYNP